MINLKNYGVAASLVFSIGALGFGAYNTYLLTGAASGNLAATKQFKKLSEGEIEKLIKAGTPVLGNMNAEVTVIEFADFQCPYCGKYFTAVFPEIKKFIDKGSARFIHMDFAFLGEESELAAMAAKCAKDQNKFWEYHAHIYENQQGENGGAFAVENLKKFAKELELDQNSFDQCLDQRKYEKAVREETALGREFGVSGTPTTFINDFMVKGLQGASYFVDRIENALK